MMVQPPQVPDRGVTTGKEACLFWQHLVSCSSEVRDPRTAVRVSTGLFLGSAHIPASIPAADVTSQFGSSVGFWACVSIVERPLCATMNRALQAAHRSQRGAEGR